MSDQQITININKFKQLAIVGGIIGAFLLAFFGGSFLVKSPTSNSTLDNNNSPKPKVAAQVKGVVEPVEYTGDVGNSVQNDNGSVYIDESIVADGIYFST